MRTARNIFYAVMFPLGNTTGKENNIHMNTKEILEGYKKADALIAYYKNKLAQTEKTAADPSLPRLYRLEAERHCDSIYSAISELYVLCGSIERLIEKSAENEVQLTLLRARYIGGRLWSEIADECCYSQQHIYRIHRQALAAVERNVPRFISCDALSALEMR